MIQITIQNSCYVVFSCQLVSRVRYARIGKLNAVKLKVGQINFILQVKKAR